MATGYAFEVRAKGMSSADPKYTLVFLADGQSTGWGWKIHNGSVQGPVLYSGNSMPIGGGRYQLCNKTGQFGSGENYGSVGAWPIDGVTAGGKYSFELKGDYNFEATCVYNGPVGLNGPSAAAIALAKGGGAGA